jgi:uncharacterized protein involved in type VI secretion and phage assembly
LSADFGGTGRPFYGKYRGSVTDVDGSTFRIKAKVPAVLGDQKTGWCTPCVPYAGDGVGLVFLPKSGAGVWIEFEAGDVSFPIWSGCYWRDGEQPGDISDTVRGFVTESPSKLLFDDDGETVTLSDANENGVKLDSNGVHLERGSGSIVVSDSEVNINDGALAVTP